MNTFNDALKHKMTQTIKITNRDAMSYATIWDMYDTYNETQGQTLVEMKKKEKDTLFKDVWCCYL